MFYRNDYKIFAQKGQDPDPNNMIKVFTVYMTFLKYCQYFSQVATSQIVQ